MSDELIGYNPLPPEGIEKPALPANPPGLLMKYFVLKPKGKDPYAKAARDAMRAYAKSIESVSPALAEELHEWAQREMLAPSDFYQPQSDHYSEFEKWLAGATFSPRDFVREFGDCDVILADEVREKVRSIVSELQSSPQGDIEQIYDSEVKRFHDHIIKNLDGKCICVTPKSDGAEHYPGCPIRSKQLVAKFMLDHGFSTGKAESIPDLLGELSKQIFELRKGAK